MHRWWLCIHVLLVLSVLTDFILTAVYCTCHHHLWRMTAMYFYIILLRYLYENWITSSLCWTFEILKNMMIRYIVLLYYLSRCYCFRMLRKLQVLPRCESQSIYTRKCLSSVVLEIMLNCLWWIRVIAHRIAYMAKGAGSEAYSL